MKILFLSIVPSPYQRDLFASLEKQDGVEIDVRYAEAASPDSPWPKTALASYESVYRSIYLSWGGKRFIVNYQLPSIDDYDAVVVNGYFTIPAQWVLRFKSGKIPLVFWGEKMQESKPGFAGKIHRFLTKPLRNVSAIVAIGKKAHRDYAERYPGKLIYELPYYCRIDNFQQAKRERPGKPVKIIFCGQMIHRKGLDILLQAFAGLIDEGYEAQLMLVGREADLPQLMEGISDKARKHVLNKGFQAPESLPGFFNEADIFVLPSRYDGWGVVVNQALGAGLPVICSEAVGAAEDLVEPAGNGFIFENGNVAALQDNLRELVSNPDLLKQFAARSREMSNDIQPDKGAEHWVSILKEISRK